MPEIKLSQDLSKVDVTPQSNKIEIETVEYVKQLTNQLNQVTAMLAELKTKGVDVDAIQSEM